MAALEWGATYAKLSPVLLVTLFGLYTTCIHAFKKTITVDIVNPWIKCRCSLWVLLLVMPLTYTTVEAIAIYQFVRLWSTQ